MGKINLHNYEAFLLDYFESNLTIEEIKELREFVLLHSELGIDLEDSELPQFGNELISPISKETFIKKHEYSLEQEAFDYVENNLDEAAKRTFEQLLEMDVQCQQQVLLYQKARLQPETGDVFTNKSMLLKNEDTLLLNNRLLNYIENQLTSKERLDLEADLANNLELLNEYKQLTLTKLPREEDVVFQDKSQLRKESKLVPLFSYTALSIAAASLLFVFALFLAVRFYNLGSASTVAAALSDRTVKPNREQVVPELVKPIEQSVESTSKKQLVPQRNHLNTVNQTTLFVAQATQTLPVLPSQDSLSLLANSILQPEIFEISDSLNMEDLALNDALTGNAQYYVPFEEETESQEEGQQKTKSKGLWQFVAQLAQKANAIGVKSLQAQKIDDEHYLLSFNSFSIEKK